MGKENKIGTSRLYIYDVPLTCCFLGIMTLASLFCLADAYPRLNCVNVGLRQSSEASAERTSDPNHLFALKALGLKNLA